MCESVVKCIESPISTNPGFDKICFQQQNVSNSCRFGNAPENAPETPPKTRPRRRRNAPENAPDRQTRCSKLHVFAKGFILNPLLIVWVLIVCFVFFVKAGSES